MGCPALYGVLYYIILIRRIIDSSMEQYKNRGAYGLFWKASPNFTKKTIFFSMKFEFTRLSVEINDTRLQNITLNLNSTGRFGKIEVFHEA